MIDTADTSSTRPYLIRALYEWCTDNGLTPFIAVLVDESVRVPNEYVKDGEIVLNVSFDATSSLNLGNEFIEFKGRFGGVARDILVPVNRVVAIYARENGQGMAFPLLASSAGPVDSTRTDDGRLGTLTPVSSTPSGDGAGAPRPTGGGRPSLTRIK
ncbi:MAG: ClpXP protease specificity-enhancing factor [Burkholderiaceae bacterium]|jgi:stringent starvation protein B|nr:ClpXP protease specificity-enhancing factor [Burkholderiaceae bacterium]